MGDARAVRLVDRARTAGLRGAARAALTAMSAPTTWARTGVAVLWVTACGFNSENPDAATLTATLGGVDTSASSSAEEDSTTSVESGDDTEDDTTGSNDTSTISPCDDGWWNAAWSRRSRLRFLGGEHDAILVDMPVLVVLEPHRFDEAAASADGSDLRFVDVNGTVVLPHEIERWNPGGTSYVWVRIPAIPYTDDEYSFWMYYGNAQATSVEAPADVWSAGYRGVWHMGTVAGAVRNSAGPTAHGDPGGTTDDPVGKIAAARTFTGPMQSDQRITLAESATFFDGWPTFTLEFWIRPNYPDDLTWESESPGRFLQKGGPLRSGRTYRPPSSDPGTGRVEVRFEFVNHGDLYRNAVLPNQTWSWVVYTYDGEVFRLFLNGVETSAIAVRGDQLIAGPNEIQLGDPVEALRGGLDELRFSDVARTPAWVEAQHRSMMDTLLAYSNPESCDE
jgi:biopolymer transport protein ExbB